MEKLREGISETEEDLKLFKTAIVDLGYPPHEDMDIGIVRAIAQAYREDKVSLLDNIDEFMCEYYNSELISDISNQWEKNVMLKKRLPILRNIIMSHNQGMYYVSIPAALSQLEGVLINAFSIKGKVNGDVLNILLKELLMQNEVEKIYNFDIEPTNTIKSMF
ncbi:hypothetical protein [Bacillus sp. SD088]|uniref:hypothetical protein n=1 Tax=Bacillus sp. SD088 TaxID=2782012 RepID=UPI001A9789CA|nr:hypothetical protein [Bacillus sp. SD088]MBO0994657.1 hypothetical protein [Bacillus sp. SD088]